MRGERYRGLGLWAALLAAGAGCSVAPDEEVLTAEDLTRIRAVGDANVSPDGKHIAYILYRPRRPFKHKDGPAWSELHVVDAKGRSRPYVTGKVNVSAVDWTPDGNGISYLAKRGDDEHQSLYVIPLHGGESRRVLSHDSAIRAYAWSPDGKELAFTAVRKASKGEKRLEEKGFNAQIFEEDWHPTELQIASGLPWPEPPEGDAEPHKRALKVDGTPSALGWSPSGRRLVVALAPTPLVDDAYMRRKVNVIDVDGGNVVAKLDNPGKLGPVRWSPDGKHLALLSAADLHDPSPGRLMVAPAAGGGLKDLLPDLRGHVAAVAWLDAKTLLYVAYVGLATKVGRVRIDGSGKQNLLGPAGPVLFTVSASRDGKTAALVGSTPTHPTEVFSLGTADGQLRRLTKHNGWLAKRKLAPQESISYKARDGLEIQAVLLRPLHFKKGQRYPLMMMVHGGPESHVPNAWITRYAQPAQLAAARGYAVLIPNYRGSTGRGVEYSKLDQADYAGKEFDDLVDGIDHLDRIGLIDRNKVGITGGSYGGYASAWAATKLSKHFAAAVMFVGISDQIAKVGTSDIPQEMFLVHGRRWPWKHWDWFRERSPIYHVEQARTPILILAGKDDPRVHPSQSLELHRYLKLLGKVPVRLVLYPGEGHGNRKAAARYDYNLRLMRWMDHYLQGKGGDPPPHALEYPLDPDKGKDGKDKAGVN